MKPESDVGTLAVVLGDQLDEQYPEHLGLDRDRDAILMVEVAGASESPPSHVQRTVLFLAAMRHHAEALRGDGWRVEYQTLADTGADGSFERAFADAFKRLRPESIACIEPGDHAVRTALEGACSDAKLELNVSSDPHFLCDLDAFSEWASGRKELILEYFYRWQRKEHGVLMTPDGKPEGGGWNFDKENRKSFRKAPEPPPSPKFPPDAITEQVMHDVAKALPDLPGSIDGFDWPVTRAQALEALDAFVADRLPRFGDFQDAMWTGEHTLYHSLLGAALNLKLLRPMEVIEAAVGAYEDGSAPINAVEGFVRQILGWREFIRGVYFHEGPRYRERNELEHHGALPEFYWTGETDMACMRNALASVLGLAYGHHIARLMVTGNFALIAGVHPGAVNDWYLGMYADAVDWVTTPNTVGMALHADGGVVGTKPYAASGKYIQRMSNYCKSCRYDVRKRSGEDACPFNVFYWDFLIRHAERFGGNRRMTMVLKNLERLDEDERVQITVSATSYRERFGIGSVEA
ncbi:MAG: cryptochrome/photolyase family protein [Planctomycetota bacterium]